MGNSLGRIEGDSRNCEERAAFGSKRVHNAGSMNDSGFDKVDREVREFLLNCVGRGDLALMFNVHPVTIDRWVREHELPFVEVAGRRMYHLPGVREWATGERLKDCYNTTPISERIGVVKAGVR